MPVQFNGFTWPVSRQSTLQGRSQVELSIQAHCTFKRKFMGIWNLLKVSLLYTIAAA